MKWYVTNGVKVKAFKTHREVMSFLSLNKDWWEVMA